MIKKTFIIGLDQDKPNKIILRLSGSKKLEPEMEELANMLSECLPNNCSISRSKC